jgi:hypothetical protein
MEARVQAFKKAVVENDTARLKREFNYTLPSRPPGFREEIAESVPHNMFCNYAGFMLAGGVVWFDEDGNVISRRR